MQIDKIFNSQKNKTKASILILSNNKKITSSFDKELFITNQVVILDNIPEAMVVVQSRRVDIIICCIYDTYLEILSFCKTIKYGELTHRVDLIVVSESLPIDLQIDFLDSGVDAFYSFTMDQKLLHSLIRNLVWKGRVKNESFPTQNKMHINIPLKKYLSVDDEFLNKVAGIVGINYFDSSFGFDEFASEMKMSKTTLHRKLKNLTNLSPVRFVKNIRLKHAAILLDNTQNNISNIAFSVGFNCPKYFAREFKISYGISPTEYRVRNSV